MHHMYLSHSLTHTLSLAHSLTHGGSTNGVTEHHQRLTIHAEELEVEHSSRCGLQRGEGER
jgi:hypothetical protein